MHVLDYRKESIFVLKFSSNIVEILICDSDVLIVRCPEGGKRSKWFLVQTVKGDDVDEGEK